MIVAKNYVLMDFLEDFLEFISLSIGGEEIWKPLNYQNVSFNYRYYCKYYHLKIYYLRKNHRNTNDEIHMANAP
jgi:hypothetical protein